MFLHNEPYGVSRTFYSKLICISLERFDLCMGAHRTFSVKGTFAHFWNLLANKKFQVSWSPVHGPSNALAGKYNILLFSSGTTFGTLTNIEHLYYPKYKVCCTSLKEQLIALLEIIVNKWLMKQTRGFANWIGIKQVLYSICTYEC